MANRVAYIAETKGLLHPEQMGGRKGRSAVDAVMALTHDIQQAKLNVTGPSEQANSKALEVVARRAWSWAADNVIVFDDPKTELMHFHNKTRNFTTNFPVTLIMALLSSLLSILDG
ncbi:unnamed protein product [Tuber aestivum]|uniref:Uncharacterized protein n=1 Tax=Tuber aestivum TaxID=59557 RepID=A0A292PJ99_9PEZI|nr:unnamed protein product [Tuber aestivum]